MASPNLKSLVGKLNAQTRRALEAAAGMCLSRTNYNVEVEHWLIKLLELEGTDLRKICKHYGIEIARLTRVTGRPAFGDAHGVLLRVSRLQA